MQETILEIETQHSLHEVRKLVRNNALIPHYAHPILENPLNKKQNFSNQYGIFLNQ